MIHRDSDRMWSVVAGCSPTAAPPSPDAVFQQIIHHAKEALDQ